MKSKRISNDDYLTLKISNDVKCDGLSIQKYVMRSIYGFGSLGNYWSLEPSWRALENKRIIFPLKGEEDRRMRRTKINLPMI